MDNRPEEDDDNEIWWKVYIGAINWGVAEKKIFGKDESEELIKNNNSLIIPTLGFIMGNDKKIVKESITLSTAAWALGKIISDDFDDNRITELIDFERDSLNIKQAILSSCFSEDNFEKIFELKNTIAELLGIPEDFFIKPCDICIRKTIKKTKKLRKRKLNEEEECKEDIKYPDLDMFNSFFLDEIQNVKNNVDSFKIGSAISKYLGQSDKPDTSDVLNNANSLDKLIYSDKVCHARWPFSPKKSAALLQAASANSILKNNRDAKLFAINGPPGTGKTTMMFNVIANLYVERAEQLAKLDSPKKAFVKKKTYTAANFQHHISELIPSLQGYEIIVASSNNAAVENISKDITCSNNIDANFNQEVDYFKWLNNDEDESKNWGLFAAVLGKRSNRSKFIEKVWKEEHIAVQRKADKSVRPQIYQHKTMFQYLNMIKNFGENRFFQHCSDEFKKCIPKYITNEEDFTNEWEKVCNRFNKRLKCINNVHQEFLKLKELKADELNQIKSLPHISIEVLKSILQDKLLNRLLVIPHTMGERFFY